jgi:peptide/nickel transport system permease protein
MLDALGTILGILLILVVVVGVLGVLALALGTRAGRKKLLQLIIVLLVVTFFSFSLLHLTPGDPARTQKPFATEAQLRPIRKEIGLDKPFLVQYKDWLFDFVRGDFGKDYSTNLPVKDSIGQQLGISLQLIFYAQFLALALAIPLGILAAYKAGTWFDKIGNAAAFGAIAIPPFVIAFVLIFYLAVQGGWFPTQQYVAFGTDPAEHFKHMFLPAVSLAIAQIAIYMRLLRSDMIQTLQEDFITMAKAKGLTNRRILWRHALRPSSFTLLTAAALNFGALIGGAVVIEVVFQLPGMGLGLVTAVATRQYSAVQAYVALIAVAFVLFNAMVDGVYSVLDPRIRHARVAAA